MSFTGYFRQTWLCIDCVCLVGAIKIVKYKILPYFGPIKYFTECQYKKL